MLKQRLMDYKNILILAAVFFSLSSVAQSKKFMLLKDRKELIKLPSLSIADKKRILKNAKFVFRDLYAHEDWKIKRYGNRANIAPLLDNLEANLDHTSEESFHTKLAEIFFRLQDYHTSYQFPKPYSCYRSVLPFSVEEVLDPSGKSKYHISEIIKDEAALAVLPEPIQFSSGDEIIRYHGIPTDEVVKKFLDNQGANPDALKRSAIFALAFRSQANSLFPEENEVKLTLRKLSGEEYTVSVPWISKEKAECVKKDETQTADNGIQRDFDEYRDLFRRSKTPKFGNMSKTSDFQKTDEPILQWKIINNEAGTFGVLKLDSFEPEKLSDTEFITLIRELLLRKLKDTDGLILDLRDNPGGYIYLGESMVQLFTPKDITPLNFTVKANASTRHFFEQKSNGSKFLAVVNDALSKNEKYSAALPLNTSESINRLGQVYYKPVAVFNNSLCYSTCDMISALVQDHGAGIIVGEDSTTGAGGANSYDLVSAYKSIKDKGPFELLPENANFGFSWRQTVRVLKNQGKILEDIGVISDYIVRPTVKDLVAGSTEQYLKISKLLKQSRAVISSVSLATSAVDLRIGARPGFLMKWENTDSIQFKVEDEILETISVEPSTLNERFVEFPSAINTNEFSNRKVQLLGHYKGQRVWKKIITLRVIPDHVEVASSYTVNPEKDLVITGENGWNISGNELRINDGIQYQTNTSTEASFFATIRNPVSLKFKAKIKTEDKFDFFKVAVVSEGHTTYLAKDLTGDLGRKDYSYDLTPYLGKSVEIRFIFESDNMENDEGVTLNSIALEPM